MVYIVIFNRCTFTKCVVRHIAADGTWLNLLYYRSTLKLESAYSLIKYSNLQTVVKKIRLGMPLLDEDFVNRNDIDAADRSDDERDTPQNQEQMV